METSAFTNDIHHLDYEQYEKVYEDKKLDVFKVSEGNKIDDFSFLYYNKSSEVIDIVDITDVSINGIMIEYYNTKSSVSLLLPGCIAYTDAEDGTILLASSLETELFSGKCGKELADGSYFCNYCGTEQLINTINTNQKQ